jgi:phosphoglycerol transferase
MRTTMPDAPVPRRALRLAAASAGPLAALLVAVAATGVLRTGLGVPLQYGQDAILHHALVKSVVDAGWWLDNPFLGAPGAGEMHDFPVNATSHFLILRGLAVAFRDWAVLENVFFLLSFPLAALAAQAFLRALGLGRGWAGAGGLLYAFLPYHLARGENHLFLATYYLVPLALWLAMRIADGSEWLIHAAPDGRRAWRLDRSALLALGAAALIGGDYPYYTAFSLLVLLVAVLFARVRRGDRRAALRGLAVMGVVVATSLAFSLPTLLYRLRHGPNPSPYHAMNARHWAESDVHSLRLASLLLPSESHPVGPLARLGATYAHAAPLPGDQSTPVGLLAAAGLVALGVGLLRLGRFEGGPWSRHGDWMVVTAWSVLAAAATGGLMTIASLLAVEVLRCPNRMTVYLGLLGLAAALLGLQGWAARRRRARAWAVAAPAAVALLGLFDQGALTWRDPRSTGAPAAFASDRALVQRLESALPAGAAVFQLPYRPMHCILSMTHRHAEQDGFRPYLHGRALRWSFGAMHGRATDHLHAAISALPAPALLDALAAEGFSAAWIDRWALPDGAQRLEAELAATLGAPPLVAPDGRHAAFPLDAWAARRREQLGPEALATIRASLRGPRVLIATGVRVEKNADPWVYTLGASGSGRLLLINDADAPRRLRVEVPSAGGPPARLAPGKATRGLVVRPLAAADGIALAFEADVPPGAHTLRFQPAGPAPPVGLVLAEPRVATLPDLARLASGAPGAPRR